MKEKIRELLSVKKESSKVASNLLDYLEYFTENELNDVYSLLTIKDNKLRKEILIKNMQEYENTIEQITKIWLKFERLKTILIYDWIHKQSRESLANLKASLKLSPNT